MRKVARVRRWVKGILTIVVLLVLVLVWAAILSPGLIRRVLDRRSADGVGEFHKHLRVLQRTGPVVARPAFRLQRRGTDGRLLSAPDDVAPTLTLLRSDAASRPLPADDTRQRRSDPFFAPGACKRRRDVLCTLLSVVIGSGLVGAIPGLRIVLAVTAAAGVVTALYLVTLARMRRRAVERSVKLRYLPQRQEEPTIVILRRAAH